jgi:hypothetical protein
LTLTDKSNHEPHLILRVESQPLESTAVNGEQAVTAGVNDAQLDKEKEEKRFQATGTVMDRLIKTVDGITQAADKFLSLG